VSAPESCPAVAVAVVSWNTRDLLRECLGSLAGEVDAERAEAWVVDNCSTDGSPEMVAAEFPWVRLLRPERNLGFGPAVNEVAARTSTPWIAAANADIALHPGALERMLAAGDADPRCAAVAPRLLLDGGETQHSVHSFPTVTLSASVYSGLPRAIPALGDRLLIEGAWRSERPRTVDWAHGALLLLRRSAFEEIGGFDPEQWMYAEDIDIAWRLREAGYRVRYEPRATVDHAVSAAAVQAFGGDREARYMRATYEWMERRRGFAFAAAFAAVNVGGLGLRMLLSGAAGALGRSRSRERARLWRHHVRMHAHGFRNRRAAPPESQGGAVRAPGDAD
jgi:N-acetylglucosaminyl-diphospho-decaprenol L-rhamnosyltransferase